MSNATLAVQLAAAQAQTAEQEQVISLLRGRLGMADAQNIALNQRLEESLWTVDKAMLVLPRHLGTLGLRAGTGSSGRGG